MMRDVKHIKANMKKKTTRILKKHAVYILFPIWFPIACFWDNFAFWLIDHDFIGSSEE